MSSSSADRSLADQHDGWTDSRHYLGLDPLTKARRVGEIDGHEKVTSPDLHALSA